ncbi:efflux RND transporter periplasmic adaptor subunit [Massilia sp. TS11]|uniref:efflux RND transporter periplasmic adaptor subunit n=1 Tax=Massilia sp. TS11 TaxID=2908003 RepID=UPI001EDC6A9D|nr:efflux RND transporter periplasmic adaptor subunit [Massilia sp. TS11]MCG2586167.1 efflux RND transporter periplasmic adaptor subunit [Massilia sp. TS11]
MLRKTLFVLAIASALAACGKKDGPAASGSASASANAKAVQLQVAAEDVTAVQSASIASGPVVTGSIQPERRADLRAEVSAVVLQVLKENGDVVKKGDILARLDETAIREAVLSAEEGERAAARAFDQAERNLTRQKTLRESGMTSAQALDDAEVRRNNAQSDLSAAKSRVSTARQQLQRTLVRAPFDGVVSDRKVSAGDTAAVGKELMKVIDPSSVRFEGRVSADRIAAVKVGQPVSFRINGYGNQEFRGVIKRVDPSANEVTRQVEVLVAFSGDTPKVSGLYAEGRIEAESNAALTLAESAIVRAGDASYAWLIKGNTLVKQPVKLGVRDPRTGNWEVTSGLAAGDNVIRNPRSNLKDGQAVAMATTKVASAAPAAAAAAQGK